MTQGITETQALRAIVGRLEMEVRTAHAFLAMCILASGGKIEVPERVAEELPNDFEVSVTRDDAIATFTVISGEEAEEFRKQQFVANPIVVPNAAGATESLLKGG